MTQDLTQTRLITKIEADFGPLFTRDTSDSRSAKCLTALILATKCGAAYSELEKHVVDGGKDFGIDGVYYNSAANILYLVQTKLRKNQKGFSEGEAHKFVAGCKKIINGQIAGANDKLQQLGPDIQNALDSITTRIQLLIAVSSSADISESVADILVEFCNAQNELDEIFQFRYLRLNDIYAPARSYNSGDPVSAKITFEQSAAITDPYKCRVGIISGTELAKLIESHADRIFDQNVRHTLSKSEVNEGIYETIKERPESFLYFNNGVTAICSDFASPANKSQGDIVSASNLSIVNGAQTTGMLFRAYNDGISLLDVKVLFRIISLEGAPARFDEDVTRSNNSQNELSALDFVSLDPKQDVLRNELSNLGYDYIIKRGGEVHSEKPRIELKDAAVAIACSRSLSLCAQAKRYVSGLWRDTESATYREIFAEDLSGGDLLHRWKVYTLTLERLKASNGFDQEEQTVIQHAEKFIVHLSAQVIRPGQNEAAQISEIDKIIVKIPEVYKKFQKNSPAYDFRNVKLMEGMMLELMNAPTS